MIAASLFFALASQFKPSDDVTLGHCPQVFDSVWLIATARVACAPLHSLEPILRPLKSKHLARLASLARQVH
jgi:hypothetical protein